MPVEIKSIPGYVESEKKDYPGAIWFANNGGEIKFDEVVLAPGAKAPVIETNMVVNSKYTWYNFIPKNLIEQFSNVANVYFLLIGIMQMIPQITTTGGSPSMYQALGFVIVVGMIRAATEDINVHQQDDKRNQKPYKVLRRQGLVDMAAGKLTRGEIIMVKKNEMLPADCLFLASSMQKQHCFIDKANLNGETCLEAMNSLISAHSFFPFAQDDKKNPIPPSSEAMAKFDCTLRYEKPNADFDKFKGCIGVTLNGKREFFTVDAKSLLLRETVLRNTDYIYGLIVYTGNSTKIQMSNNAGVKAAVKVSRIMRWVQNYLKIMFCCQFLLCIIGGAVAGLFLKGHQETHWYLRTQDESAANFGFECFGTWYILLCQMVPITLMVSSEVVKYSQARFIAQDIRMYNQKINKPAICNTSTIHEELGLVDYVFSDKTGTLTQNQMTFRFCALGTASRDEYGSTMTEIAKSVVRRQQELEMFNKTGRLPDTHPWTKLARPLWPEPDPNYEADCLEKSCFSSCWGKKPQPIENVENLLPANEFSKDELNQLYLGLWGPPQNGESAETHAIRQQYLRVYCTHLALSNTVDPIEETKNGVPTINFQAESAEEKAMSEFSHLIGFTKRKRAEGGYWLETTQMDPTLSTKSVVKEQYHHVATFGFTSQRARVCVIYQVGADGNEVHVMMKGQDTTAMPLMTDINVENDVALKSKLNDCCSKGLRTLVGGYSILPSSWWKERRDEYERIKGLDSSPLSVGHPGKCQPGCEKCAQHNFYEQCEKDAQLKYLGIIGMEDQLQVMVPQTIADCLRAEIRVWMITGDKLETAKNIGLACNLIDPDMIPVIKPNMSLSQMCECYSTARLIEVTGQWASIVKNTDELEKMFDAFDSDKSGGICLNELKSLMTAMRCSIADEELSRLFNDHAKGGQAIDRVGFLKMMASASISLKDAVHFDIESGLKRWHHIENYSSHTKEPISLLINREAFLVMFPAGKDTTKLVTAEDKELEQIRAKFFDLASKSKSVVFARAEPAMKKRMVTETKMRSPHVITLAIGDGANDADMIKAAHVGVGVAGIEGTAAVAASDYAIGTFRFLHTLLFVHGHWSYSRIAMLVNFIFYKASLVAITQYYYGFYSGFSAQAFYNDPIYQWYNTFYTAAPIMAIAIWERALPANLLENNPGAVKMHKDTLFNSTIFFQWILRAVIHAIVIVGIPFATVDAALENQSSDLWYTSTVSFYCCCLIPTFLILFDIQSFTFLHGFAFVICSFGSIFIWIWILSFLENPDILGAPEYILGNLNTWLIMIVTIMIPMLLELVFRGYCVMHDPSFTHVLREKYFVAREQFAKEGKKGLGLASLSIVMTGGDVEKWTSLQNAKKKPQELKVVATETGKVVEVKEGKSAFKVMAQMLKLKNASGANFAATENLEQFVQHDTFRQDQPGFEKLREENSRS